MIIRNRHTLLLSVMILAACGGPRVNTYNVKNAIDEVSASPLSANQAAIQEEVNVQLDSSAALACTAKWELTTNEQGVAHTKVVCDPISLQAVPPQNPSTCKIIGLQSDRQTGSPRFIEALRLVFLPTFNQCSKP